MASPTSRLLELLELLQARPLTTGREIADLLRIDPRTVRRYVDVLQELGIPVEGQRGVGGGYRIRPGYRLPPLMLGDEEAVVVVLGPARDSRVGPDGSSAAVDGALAKINRVLPVDAPPPGRGARGDARLHDDDAAARPGTPARCSCSPMRSAAAGGSVPPTARSQARRPERELSPHGLVVHSGRWYLAAHDHLRDDLRTFRVDRMWRVALAEGEAVPPPDGFDAVAHVSRSLARVPWKWEVEVLLDLPVDEAARRIPATLAELVDDPDGTLLRMRVGSLDWMATVLAGLGCGFTIRRPDELGASVRALAEQLVAQVNVQPRPA